MAMLFMAEDDPLMSRMYERTFKAAGFELKISADGEAALEVLSTMQPKPVLAILDVMMPKKSGFDVLRAMKADPELKKIPVILLTNLAGQSDAEKGIEMGAELYLVKSQFSPKEVVEKVSGIIASHSKGGKSVKQKK